MKSIGELADSYENWALQDETIAEGILLAIGQCPPEVRSKQLERADMLVVEAAKFRSHAAELRASGLFTPVSHAMGFANWRGTFV